DVRRRFGLDSRPLSLSDHMIVARGLRRTVVLLVDSVVGTVAGAPVDWVSAQGVVPGADDAIVGVVRLSDGLLLIHDLDRFLSAAEEEQLDRALAAKGGSEGGGG
ncbi:chemotaxis protein CheW, partial [Nitrospirillum viridazoti]